MKVKRIYCLLLTANCLFVFSCGSKEPKQISIPGNILPQEKMANVLTDIHLAEAEATMKTLPDSTSQTKINFENIFSKDGISKAQYDTSISFYIAHPELLDTVYVQVLNELSKMQAEKK